MKLSAKLLAVLVPVVVGYGVLDHGLQRRVIGPSFTELEAERAGSDAERSIGAIRGEIEHLAARARGLAARTALERLIADGDPSAVEDQLGAPLFEAEGLDLAYVCDLSGRRLWSGARDPHDRTPIVLREFPEGQLKPGHVALRLRVPSRNIDDPGGEVVGLLETEREPLMLASVAVLKGQQPVGRVILGRFLTDARVAAIAERARLQFSLSPIMGLDRDALPADLRSAVDGATATPAPIVREASGELLQAYTTFDDVRGRPTLLVTTDVQRTISERGGVAMRYALGSTLAAGLLLLWVLVRCLQRIVIGPIAGLTEHAVRVGKSDDTTARLNLERDDEVGVLAGEFDSMLEKLEHSRIALVETARTAGMSEIATGILHNVGNTLNSVGVASSMIEASVRNCRSAGLAKVSALLEEHAEDLPGFVANDPRGQKLLPLLRALSQASEEDRERTLAEVATLTEGLEHIRSLVASQQEFATRTTVVQVCSLSDLVTKAVEITEQASTDDARLEVVRDDAPLPGYPTDRGKLLGLLVNLVQNARQAIDEQGPSAPRLELRVQPSPEGGVRIEVRDNGCGIDPESIGSLFEHGFTTKPQGHGFGLHSAANSATELGGRLTAASEGPGQGAAFTLDLPAPQSTENERADAA